mmetsp:Transcript_18375/g.42065  ORF Transcript_18375/g.42065 Transcript_18375/m.42065 type:complete len:209 (-) Transcript_18375:1105-1731(-)
MYGEYATISVPPLVIPFLRLLLLRRPLLPFFIQYLISRLSRTVHPILLQQRGILQSIVRVSCGSQLHKSKGGKGYSNLGHQHGASIKFEGTFEFRLASVRLLVGIDPLQSTDKYFFLMYGRISIDSRNVFDIVFCNKHFVSPPHFVNKPTLGTTIIICVGKLQDKVTPSWRQRCPVFKPRAMLSFHEDIETVSVYLKHYRTWLAKHGR